MSEAVSTDLTALAASHAAPLAADPVRTGEREAARFLIWSAVAFAFALGLAWLYVALMPMAFLSRDYPLWIAKRTMLDECRLGSVSVFGDSRTVAATMPEAMPIPVTNFALSGTTPIETYFAVQRALRCPTPPKLVMIAHGPLKFGGDSDYWAFGPRTGFLSYSDMRAVDGDAAHLHDSEIEDLRRGDQLWPPLREMLFSTRFPALYFDSLVNAFGAARWQHNLTALQDNLRSSGHALFGTASGSSDIASEGQGNGFHVSPLIDLYFSRTLALLAARGVPVVFVSMPINQATYAHVPAHFRDQFADYLQAKAAQFPTLHVIGPVIPCWPDRFFGDAWHFNAQGAELYSHGLGTWLRDALAGQAAKDLPDRCATAS